MSCALLVVATVLSVAGRLAVAAPADRVNVEALGAWQGREVTGLEITGMPAGLADRARSGLALTPRGGFLSRELATLTLDRARADADRLRLLLARSGHPDARVEASATADGSDGATVAFQVEPGPAVTYGQVEVRGLPDAAAAARDSVSVILARDERFSDQAVSRVRSGLDTAMQRAGHARPEVQVSVQRVATDRAAVTFTCTPGPVFVYEDLVVSGAPPDLERLVHRVVSLEPGTPYAPRVADEARRSVRRLGLFRSSRFNSTVADSGALDLVADLAPRKMITLEAGVGSFTDNWYVLSAGVTHRNLFGGGRGAALTGEYATHEREAELRTWWPALLTSRSRTDLQLRRRILDEDSYGLTKNELELSTLFEHWRRNSLRTSVTLSDGDLEVRSEFPGQEVALEDGLQTVWSAMWYRDTTDSPIFPRVGSRWTLSGDVSVPGVLTEAPFAGLRGQTTRYLPLGARRTLALRLDAAWARPLGDAAGLRPDRRWFAGGVSTMRGYGRHELGPRDTEGRPLGGEARLLAGAELRALVSPPFGLAVFVDSGQVWARRADVALADLAVASGLGILVETPVGPIRLDWAYNLTDTPDDVGDWKLQFAIGHPY